MKKIKVLFIHHATGIGGAPISMLHLIKNLDKKRFDVKVMFISNSNLVDYYRENGVEVEVLNAENKYFSLSKESSKINFLSYFRYTGIYRNWKKTATEIAPAFFAKHDFDIVHLNSHVLTSWAQAAHAMGKKVVMHNREAISKGRLGIRYKIFKKLVEKNCDLVINISEDNKRRLGIKQRSVVVYNPVFIPQVYRTPMDNPGKKVQVLYLGGAAAFKGFNVIADSLQYLDKNVEVIFAGAYGRIGGEKTVKEKLVKLVKLIVYRDQYKSLPVINANANARIAGMVSNSLEYIDACDILITPFIVEHFSRPAIEAFAYGKPVIGSNVEGMDEIIDHNINGMLVQKGNAKELADAINFLAANPQRAREMGEEGRKKALRLFAAEKCARRVEQLYIDVLNNNIKEQN
ncbi:MAG: glycosyltransferase family 4 protein [Ferruginibacter sp.]